MIVTEVYRTRTDGVVLLRTYSDSGYQIERDGALYDEAIDPTDANRVYTESKTLKEEELTAEEEIATYKAALQELGVETEDDNA